ncbi:hypothetical protein TGGT1_245428 [Toxoplasma gondii GT1]|nr:hypothetical protein TGGT1_245428 [Toxoplasma gondii GT1]
MHRLRSKSCGSLNKENYFAETGRGLPLQNHVRVPLQASIARRLSDRESEKRSQGGDNGNGTTPPLPPRRTPSPRPSGASGVVQQSGAGLGTSIMLGTGGQHLSDQGATGAVAPSVQSSSAAVASGAGALPLVQFFGRPSSSSQSAHLCPACRNVEEAVAKRNVLRGRRQAAAREAAQRIAELELQHLQLVRTFRYGGLEQVGRMGNILESHQMLRQARRDAEQEERVSRDEEAALSAFIDKSSDRQEAEERVAGEVLRQRLQNQLAQYAVLRIEAAIERQRQMVQLQRQLVDVLAQRLGAENQEERALLDAEADRILQEIEHAADPARNPQRGRRKPA